MRLKQLFVPVKSMDKDEAQRFMAEHSEGTFTLLDVRQPGEYEEGHIPGAKLIPLPELHASHGELDSNKPIIVYCAVGGRSRVAAQLLSGLGFEELYNLSGGIKAWKGLKAKGPMALNLDMISGDESPIEIVEIAYSLESALQAFYSEICERTEDEELRKLLSKLMEFEESHKQRLIELGARIDPDFEGPKRPDSGESDSGIMEGGFDTEEMLRVNEPFLQTAPEIIDLAMMFEAQALDLYLRFSDTESDPQTKGVLYEIAEEEKAHLSSLGRLLEERI
jgi:rhodanese-related sulfurtransferase/rubrerythrin